MKFSAFALFQLGVLMAQRFHLNHLIVEKSTEVRIDFIALEMHVCENELSLDTNLNWCQPVLGIFARK